MTEQLTAPQQQAVDHFEGPLLVLAGPGSGKTRVITHRISRLLQRGVSDKQILALTFTNKAAREMSQRVQSLLGGVRVEVSTFHRFCARLLRRWPELAGLQQNFTILDASDQVQLVRLIMKDLGFDTTLHDPRRVLNRISRARNDLISAEAFRLRHEERIGDLLDAVVCEVFAEYEQKLVSQNSVDFDGLLLHVVQMLSENDDLREYLDLQFRFVLVDEYQDTNLAQYRIVQAFSQKCPNLCVTGDPDQSIYGWRGARPNNITQFEQDFPDVQIVTLDQNFRSTQAIVACADSLISHNRRRHPRTLFTENEQGNAVQLKVFADAEAEADGIAAEIAAAVESGNRRWADFAVFYRVNALSRALETALSRHGVPFQVAAGYSFYERAEVRDLLGYLRLIENPDDDVAFLRIVNRPARGIGRKTIERLSEFAARNSLSMLQAAHHVGEITEIRGRARRQLMFFADLIQTLHEKSVDGHVRSLIERLIAEIDYLALWKDENEEVDQDREANVYEFVRAARIYEDSLHGTGASPSLQGFLEMATLTSEADNIDESRGAVTLMTMHAAKGLEFPCVYVMGVESGLIPHDRAVHNGDPASFEEERRLLFVAITRAMQELKLTQTRQRDFRGSRRYTISSPFLAEMPIECDSADARESFSDSTADDLAEARRRYRLSQSGRNSRLLMSGADLSRELECSEEAQADEKSGIGISQSDKIASLQSSLKQFAGRNDTSAEAIDAAFQPGNFVRHPRYGRGVIVDISGRPGRTTVKVRFDTGDDEETFVLEHCPLQPLGGHRPR